MNDLVSLKVTKRLPQTHTTQYLNIKTFLTISILLSLKFMKSEFYFIIEEVELVIRS